MSKETFTTDKNGEVTHVRETSDDGRTSYLYEADTSFSGLLLNGGKGKLVEVADHNEDGTTDAYEADDSISKPSAVRYFVTLSA